MAPQQSPPTSLSLLADLCRSTPGTESWARFVALYHPAIVGWCRRRGLPDADAEDVAQVVFQLLVRKLPEFHYEPGKAGFRAWLHKVTRNEVASYLRRESRQRFAALPEDVGCQAEGLLSALAERDLIETALQRARAEADPLDWRVFDTVVLQQRPVADAGVPPAAVYRACWRARQLVAAELARLENDSEVGA